MSTNDRDARIAKARAARNARQAANTDPEGIIGYISATTRKRMSVACNWVLRFYKHMVDNNAHTTTVPIVASFGTVPTLSYGIVTEFLTFFAKHAAAMRDDVPAVRSARAIYGGLRLLYERVLKQDIDPKAADAAKDTVKQLKKDGLLSSSPIDPSYVTAEAFEALARAALGLSWHPRNTRVRWEFLLLQSMELSSATRFASHLPSEIEPIATARPVVFSDFKVVIKRGTGKYTDISLNYKPAKQKTLTNQKDEYVLHARDALWRCPVLWFLVVSELQAACQYSASELYDPAILQGDSTRIIECKPEYRSTPVLGRFNDRQYGHPYWTTHNAIRTLNTLSRIARLPRLVKMHDYRRTIAITMWARGKSLKDIATTLGQAVTQVTRVYINAFATTAGGAAVFGNDDDIMDAIRTHPNTVTPVAVPPVMPPISCLRRAYNEDEVVAAKEESDALCSEIYSQYDAATTPPAQKARMTQAWLKYTTRLYKWVKYYQEADLWDQSENGNDAGPAAPIPIIDADIPETVVSLSTDATTTAAPTDMLEQVISDGSKYDYNADALEGILGSYAMDTVQGSTDFVDAYGAHDDTDDDEDYDLDHCLDLPDDSDFVLDPCLIGVGVSDDLALAPVTATHSTHRGDTGSMDRDKGKRGNRKSTTDNDDEDGDAEEGVEEEDYEQDKDAICLLSTIADIALDADRGRDAVEDRLRIINEYVPQLPETSIGWYGYRPGHYPIDGKCPAHGIPLQECVPRSGAQAQVQQRAHVHLHMGKIAGERYAAKLLQRYPTTVPSNLLRQLVSTGRKQATSDPVKAYIRINLLRSYKTIALCGLCDTRVDLLNGAQAASHFLLEHDILITRKNASGRGNKGGEWRISDLVPDHPVWDREQSKYIVDPKEVELHCRGQYNALVSATDNVGAYGLRSDTIIPSNILPGESRNLPADTKYCLLRKTGVIEQPGLCMICVHDHSKPWSDRMREHEGIQFYRWHIYTCLTEWCRNVKEWIAGKPMRKKGKGADIKKHNDNCDAYDAIRPACLSADGKYECLDPVCVRNHIEYRDMLSLLQHWILAHYYKPFWMPQGRIAVIRPLDTVIPLIATCFNIITLDTGLEYVLEGCRYLDKKGRTITEERRIYKTTWGAEQKKEDKERRKAGIPLRKPEDTGGRKKVKGKGKLDTPGEDDEDKDQEDKDNQDNEREADIVAKNSAGKRNVKGRKVMRDTQATGDDGMRLDVEDEYGQAGPSVTSSARIERRSKKRKVTTSTDE